MFDLLIKNGRIVDGTGSPETSGNVAVKDGRIVGVGDIDGEAKETVDASGKVVCPGFIDVHTHYDAQVFWDGTVSPSCYHGVTTVFGGHCGFSIAPLSPEAGGYLMPMLARVEGMPIEALEEGVPWDWSSFGDYLGKLDGKLGVNAGFMAGHSAIRRVVMGERAVGNEATPEELEQMKALLAASLEQGATGFSSTCAPTHNDADGDPVPSRAASREEIVELAGVCRDYEGTALEFLPGLGVFTDAEKELCADMSVAAQRPLNWNVLVANSKAPDFIENQLSATDYARSQGGEVIALTVPQPMTVRINLYSGFIFDALGGWADLFKLSIEDRKIALRDPQKREELDQRAQSKESGGLRAVANWAALNVMEVVKPENKKYEGRTVGDIAEELGKLPLDAMLDLALSDDLKTCFMPPAFGGDEETWSMRGDLWADDRTVIGASDAGAHLDMIDTFAFSTQVLGNGVREKKVITLEAAIHQLTDRLGRLYGVRDRGLLREGWYADIVIFDPETVNVGETYTKDDLPAGAGRLYAEANGIEQVFVNGVQTIRDGEHTGDLPGTVLRSGTDTYTPPMPLTATPPVADAAE